MHLHFGDDAVNSLLRTFSAMYCGLAACLVHPLLDYLIVGFLSCFSRTASFQKCIYKSPSSVEVL